MDSQEKNSTPQLLLAGSVPSNDLRTFDEEIDTAAKEARTEPEATDAATPAEQLPPPPVPAEAIFRPEPDQLPEPPEEDVEVRKWSKAELNTSLEMFVNFRNMLQSQLLAIIAKTGDAAKYEMNEEQLNYIARIYAPFFRKYGNKIPDWLWLLLGEGVILTPLIKQAMNDRKTVRSNQHLAASGVVAARAGTAGAEKKERTQWKIDSKGILRARCIWKLCAGC